MGLRPGPLELASRVPVTVQRAVGTLDATDIVIVPSVVLGPEGWRKGRYPELVEWLRAMHGRGAMLCSACSGIFLIAETGLFDGVDATVHFGYARAFADAYPAVRIHPERVLVISGLREELVTSGASMTWHDLVLYLIARHAGATAAQDVARFFALQWHQDGLAPYIVFEGRHDHGDRAIEAAQDWVAGHFSVADPVEEMVRRSGLAERTFKRRFTRRPASARSPTCSASGSRTPSAASSGRRRRSMRSAGRSATRNPLSSAASSGASRVLRRGPTAGASGFPTSPDLTRTPIRCSRWFLQC